MYISTLLPIVQEKDKFRDKFGLCFYSVSLSNSLKADFSRHNIPKCAHYHPKLSYFSTFDEIFDYFVPENDYNSPKIK